MKKNKLTIILIVLSSLVLGIFMKTYLENYKTKQAFNKTVDYKQLPNIEQVVSDISSNGFISRDIGKKGNDVTTKYIEDLFKKINLEPIFDSSYLNRFKYEELKINNVVGKIRGKNNKTAIILTAHFDAWGKGVLDNASGVSTILEIAKTLKKYSEQNKLNNDVIFCMTNAEMKGFEGSKSFINDIKPMYTNLYNVNIDCVCSKDGAPLALKNISKIPESSKLYDSIKDTFKKNNIEFLDVVSSKKLDMLIKCNSGVSDYFAFEKNGIPNIHISKSKLENLQEKENDGPETLDFNELKKLADAITEWIQEFSAQ